MKAMMISVALVLAMGCGKEADPEPQGPTKAAAKPAVPDSKKGQPTPKKETPQPKAGPKTADQKPGTVLWEFETGHQASGPSIGNDGTVYVGSVDKKVYALDGQTGVKKWEFETGGMVISSSAIGPDNTVYVGSYDKKVYALDGKTGAKKWEFETGKPVVSSPAIGADGIIYIGAWDEKVYALDGASGVKKWEFEIQKGLFSSPVVGFNNTVYAASVEVDVKNGVFCALAGQTGVKKWEHKAKRNVTYAPTIVPAIGSDNVVYLGISLDILGDEGKLIALNGKTGTVKWEFDLNCLPSPPVIGADKIIYFGTWGASGDGLFYSVDGKSGLKKWEYKLQGDALGAAQMIASPAIGDNGTVYIGANTGRKGEVLALNGESGAKKWALKIGAINGIVIGNDGTIYVGSLDKKVYALKTDSQGPAKSPWPMRGQNPQHTGRAPAK